jgi:hypothetical protein
MIELAIFLKRNGYKPDQVQDFIPAPLDIATSMYYTGLDPFSLKEIFIAKALRDRKSQRALMQFFKPENYFEVRDALRQADRNDLIGEGCDCLIPSKPPREAIDRRREDANKRFRGDYVHTIPNVDAENGQTPSDQKTPTKNVQSNAADSSTTPKPSDESSQAKSNHLKKGSQKQQRDRRPKGDSPGVGYRPGRRV